MFSRSKEGEPSITRKARGIMFRSMSPLSKQRRRVKLDGNDRSETDTEASASRHLLKDSDSDSNHHNKVGTAQQRGRRANDGPHPEDEDGSSVSSSSSSSNSSNSNAKRMGLLARVRSRSRSSSSSRSRGSSTDVQERPRQVVVAVTSCRSDAYHHPKGGSRSVLPRNAPPVLKLFHELAVGVQDAYAAVGATPTKPEPSAEGDTRQSQVEAEGKNVLWEFMEHLDFVSNTLLQAFVIQLFAICVVQRLTLFFMHVRSCLL